MSETTSDKHKRLVGQAAHARAVKAARDKKHQKLTRGIRLTLRNEVVDALKEEAERRDVALGLLVREAVDVYLRTIRKPIKRGGWS